MQRIFANLSMESKQHIYSISILHISISYIILHKIDIIYLSEGYHDSTTPIDDEFLSLPLRVVNIDYLHHGGMTEKEI